MVPWGGGDEKYIAFESHSMEEGNISRHAEELLVNNQLYALSNVFNYFTSLHISCNSVLIIRKINCINTSSGIYHSV
jgi:hypothetical protein